MKNTSDHDPASFTLFVSILGALAGVIAGYGLDRVVESRRLLALLAAVFAVAVIVAFRNSLGRISPTLRVWRAGSKIQSYFWIATCLATIIGGLAGHDLCELGQVASGAVVGFASGALAAVSLATLMVFYFYEHPETGVEF
jgi:hypothetical protein